MSSNRATRTKRIARGKCSVCLVRRHSIFRNCAGCGERIRYLEIVSYDAEEDQWLHEGCDPPEPEITATDLAHAVIARAKEPGA